MRRIRYIASIFLSACLWATLPLALGFLNDKMTPSGRDLFVQGLPKTILFSIIFFLPLAALMHWLWARTTLQTTGMRFWLLPLKTLPTAYLFGWLLMLPIVIIKEGFWHRPIGEYGSGLLYMFVVYAFVLLVSVIWIVYPLALVNQFVICALLGEKQKC